MNTEASNNFYTVSLVFSIIGGLLLLLTDFGGWTENTYYGTNDYYVFIGSEYAPAYSQIMLAVMGLACFGIAFISYQGMQRNLSADMLQKGILLGAGTVALVALSAVLFLIEAEDAVYNWLDVGFYGGLLGSGLATLFLKLQQNSSG